MELPSPSISRIVEDTKSADLGGDPRRTARLEKVVDRLARNPSATLPDMVESDAELEGLYRLVNNSQVTMSALHAAHAAGAASRARQEQLVLAIHDTTPIHCPHADPASVGFLNTGKPGFYAHYTLLASEASRLPLGVSYLETIVRTKPPTKRKPGQQKRRTTSGSQTRKKKNREFERWFRGIEATQDCLDGVAVIHVADRESDSYELMAKTTGSKCRFVFRVRIAERNAQLETGEAGPLRELAARTEGALTREVPLSTRKPRTAPNGAKAHPPRKGRIATLNFSATKVEIRRPNYLGKEYPGTLALNLVRVWEPEPPADEDPVEWLLYTTEPIDTPEQIARVIDIYRTRWLIEECNKALKSGCKIEEREFETYQAMSVMLAISLPIACEILRLRSAAREAPDSPASTVLNPVQIEILRRFGSRKLPDTPTARDALLAVAAMGGHLRRNGEPGWLVLYRGMSKLLDREKVWRVAVSRPQDL